MSDAAPPPWIRRQEIAAKRVGSQMERRIAADPRLEQHVGGHSPFGFGSSMYAARSRPHAQAMHRRRVAGIIASRLAADALEPPPPHLDAPYCPDCASSCGTTDREDLSGLWVACGACGHSWQDRDARVQAERADRAYAQHLDDEAQRERDEARLGDELVAINARLLAEKAERAATSRRPEQIAMNL